MKTATHYKVSFAIPPVNLIDALVNLAVEVGIYVNGKSPNDVMRTLFKRYGESAYAMLRDHHHPSGKLP